MKKIFTIIAIVMAAALINSCGTASKISADDKEVQKEAKAFLKSAKKNGFRVMESGDELQNVYRYLKAKKENGMHRDIIASADTDKNAVSQKKALDDILFQYTELVNLAEIKEREVREIADINDKTFDNFYSAYEKKVKGLASLSNLKILMLRKDYVLNGVARTAYEIYAIEDLNAHNKRMEAIRDAAKETGIAVEWAEQVSDWVNGR